ncbi:MAG TPA: TIGR03435 family protein [Bryobacteraceae bacterium]|nr:TIGR03435 family protein [Bryobacteraceae bacterium]
MRKNLYAVTFGMLVALACFGQTKTDSAVQFDVVSVKMHSPDNQGGRMQLMPDGVRLQNIPLPDFIREAYGLSENDQIVGIPAWANSERFDIEAKVDSADVAAFRKLTLDQIQGMGRTILADRFKCASHMEQKILPVYALAVAKDGPKLKTSTMSDQDINARTGVIGMSHASNGSGAVNQLTATGVTMDRLASALSKQGLGRVVLDNTNLTGRYDFTLSWSPENAPGETSGPSIFTAIAEQLGLKLESEKGPVPVLVIDHIGAPSPN